MPAPDLDEFLRLAKTYDRIPLTEVLLADAETPLTAFHKLHRGGDGFLLESVEGGERWGRYSFLGTNPRQVVTWDVQGCRGVDGDEVREFESLEEALRAETRNVATFQPEELPRFAGGFVGHLSYDATELLEPATRRDPRAPGERPLRPLSGWAFARFGLYLDVVLFDNVTKRMFVVAWAEVHRHASPRAAYEEAQGRLEGTRRRLRAEAPLPELAWPREPSPLPWNDATPSAETYRERVEDAKRAIRAGDLIQVVLARRFTFERCERPFDLYRILRTLNPSPYLFYVDQGDRQLVGASPEMILRVDEGRLVIHPIAGTRRRGRDTAEDEALAAELRADPKEMAEHVMLVDLGRNDVGRIAIPGTVETTSFAALEKYSHVMHLTSVVEGSLPPGQDVLDALRACFPAGTVSGAPKVRAMQWIGRHEEPRGPYAGAVGYVSFDGDGDLAIAIRTVFVEEERTWCMAGAGIVADSDPRLETLETENKARVAQMALSILAAQEEVHP